MKKVLESLREELKRASSHDRRKIVQEALDEAGEMEVELSPQARQLLTSVMLQNPCDVYRVRTMLESMKTSALVRDRDCDLTIQVLEYLDGSLSQISAEAYHVLHTALGKTMAHVMV